jgi:hypothetical protein
VDLPEIAEVKRLTVRPGDKLVVRLVRRPDEHEAHEIRERVQAILGAPVLVLGPDADLEVIENATVRG